MSDRRTDHTQERESLGATLEWLVEIGVDHAYTRALAEDVFALKDRLEAAEREQDRQDGLIARLAHDAKAAESALEEAREALREFGHHTEDCRSRTLAPPMNYCDCGLDTAFASSPEARPEQEPRCPTCDSEITFDYLGPDRNDPSGEAWGDSCSNPDCPSHLSAANEITLTEEEAALVRMFVAQPCENPDCTDPPCIAKREVLALLASRRKESKEAPPKKGLSQPREK